MSLTKSDSGSTRLLTIVLSVVFFGSMIGHEVAIEGLWESFSDIPEGIALYITMFQFVSCCFGPWCIKTFVTGPKKEVSATDNGGQIMNNQGTEIESGIGARPVEQEQPQEWYWQWVPYLGLSMLVFLSTALANHSVHYVQYPVKVVFKSSKLLPTMLVSTLMGNSKPYSIMDYAAAVLLCGGTAGFAFGGGRSGEEDTDSMTLVYGCSLLLISVCSDAFVPNAQQKIMTQGVSAEDLMIKTNLIGSCVLGLAMLVTGHLAACLRFSIRHPMANLNLSLCGITLFIAVFCMTKLVKISGSVFAVTVATLRKAGTVLLSYLVFPKEATLVHVFSLISVGSGLVMHEFNSQSKKLEYQRIKSSGADLHALSPHGSESQRG